jgi:hypothetical protein
MASQPTADATSAQADVLVIFGITGDLAKVSAADQLTAAYGGWREPWMAPTS